MRPITPLQNNQDSSKPPDLCLRSLRNPADPLDKAVDTDDRPLPNKRGTGDHTEKVRKESTSGGLLASVLQAGLDQAGEEGVRLGRPGLELRVGLGAHIEGVLVLGELHELG